MWEFLNEHGVRLHKSEDFQAIGRVGVGGDLIGVVAYNGFCGRVCSMHMAGVGNWVSREFILAAFSYPFKQLDMLAVISPIAESNHRALRFDKHFGFREVHRVPDGYEEGVDLIFLEMRKEDCRYLDEVKRELAEAA